jgi:hypothetical protein
MVHKIGLSLPPRYVPTATTMLSLPPRYVPTATTKMFCVWVGGWVGVGADGTFWDVF